MIPRRLYIVSCYEQYSLHFFSSVCAPTCLLDSQFTHTQYFKWIRIIFARLCILEIYWVRKLEKTFSRYSIWVFISVCCWISPYFVHISAVFHSDISLNMKLIPNIGSKLLSQKNSYQNKIILLNHFIIEQKETWTAKNWMRKR